MSSQQKIASALSSSIDSPESVPTSPLVPFVELVAHAVALLMSGAMSDGVEAQLMVSLAKYGSSIPAESYVREQWTNIINGCKGLCLWATRVIECLANVESLVPTDAGQNAVPILTVTVDDLRPELDAASWTNVANVTPRSPKVRVLAGVLGLGATTSEHLQALSSQARKCGLLGEIVPSSADGYTVYSERVEELARMVTRALLCTTPMLEFRCIEAAKLPSGEGFEVHNYAFHLNAAAVWKLRQSGKYTTGAMSWATLAPQGNNDMHFPSTNRIRANSVLTQTLCDLSSSFLPEEATCFNTPSPTVQSRSPQCETVTKQNCVRRLLL